MNVADPLSRHPSFFAESSTSKLLFIGNSLSTASLQYIILHIDWEHYSALDVLGYHLP